MFQRGLEAADGHDVHADRIWPQNVSLWGIADEQDLLGREPQLSADKMEDLPLRLHQPDLKGEHESIWNAWNDGQERLGVWEGEVRTDPNP